MPFYASKLTDVLSAHLSSWNQARLKFMARYVNSLLQLATTNGKELALTLNSEVKNDSNYRRIQRFMSEYDFGFERFGQFLLSLLPQASDFVVAMDRTEWHFGSKPVNVLMIGVAYKGIAFPVLWDVLSIGGEDEAGEEDEAKGKAGCSSTAERKTLFERFLQLVPAEKTRAFVADREFISAEWLGFLAGRDVPFVIRIRSSRKISLGAASSEGRAARTFFQDMPPCEKIRCLGAGEEPCFVGGQKVRVMGKRLDKEDDEFLILIASPEISSARAPKLYRRRWEIETLFSAMKSRGFDLEATHMSAPERIAKLVGLIGLAFVWAHLVGQERHERDPIKIKKHGWREKSFFRYGLERLRSIMLNFHAKKEEFRRCIRVLTQPANFFVV